MAQGSEIQPHTLCHGQHRSTLVINGSKHIHVHPAPPGKSIGAVQSSVNCRHEEPREKRADRGEDLDQAVAPCQLVGLVVARAHVHDCREMARLEQANAAKKSEDKRCEKNWRLGSQEAEDIELVDIFDTSVRKREDGPSELQECDIQRSIDLASMSTHEATWVLGNLPV